MAGSHATATRVSWGAGEEQVGCGRTSRDGLDAAGVGEAELCPPLLEGCVGICEAGCERVAGQEAEEGVGAGRHCRSGRGGRDVSGRGSGWWDEGGGEGAAGRGGAGRARELGRAGRGGWSAKRRLAGGWCEGSRCRDVGNGWGSAGQASSKEQQSWTKNFTNAWTARYWPLLLGSLGAAAVHGSGVGATGDDTPPEWENQSPIAGLPKIGPVRGTYPPNVIPPSWLHRDCPAVAWESGFTPIVHHQIRGSTPAPDLTVPARRGFRLTRNVPHRVTQASSGLNRCSDKPPRRFGAWQSIGWGFWALALEEG